MLTYVELLKAMHTSGADYAWIGMNAAGAYGATVGSLDFDFFVRPQPAHLDSARAAFRALGMVEQFPQVASTVLIAAGTTVAFADPLGGPSVDLLTEISGPSFDEVWREHRLIEFSGVQVQIASMRHIVESKRAANRPKDRQSLKRWEEDLGQQLRESPAKYRVSKKRK